MSDNIILFMYDLKIINFFEYEFDNKRRSSTYPIELIMKLAIAVKMKIKMSLSNMHILLKDIGFLQN